MIKKIREWIDGDENEEIIKVVYEQPTESEERINRLLENIKKKALDKKIIRIGGEMYLPSVYSIFLSAEDFRNLLDSERKFIEKKLKEIILEKAKDLAGDNKLTTEKVEVKIYQDATLSNNEVEVKNSDNLEDTLDLGHFKYNHLNKTFDPDKTIKFETVDLYPLPKTVEINPQENPVTDIDGTIDMPSIGNSTGTIDADDVIDFEPLYYLEVWKDEKKIEEFPILKNQVTIGRDTKEKSANIKLKTDDKQVSRLHAAIKFKSKFDITVESLHKNISKVGKIVISKGKPDFPIETKLENGDEIQIFDFKIKFRF